MSLTVTCSVPTRDVTHDDRVSEKAGYKQWRAHPWLRGKAGCALKWSMAESKKNAWKEDNHGTVFGGIKNKIARKEKFQASSVEWKGSR